MTQEQFDSLLTAASTYANQVNATFNLFLTVALSSLAFAAALPLDKIGGEFLNTGLSSSSLLMGSVLFSFYLICFISFIKSQYHLNSLLFELQEHVEKWDVKQRAIDAFTPHPPIFLKLSLPSIGFLIGSAGCLFVFLWVSNVARLT